MSKPLAYIGIDPGAKGALCLLVPELKKAYFIDTVARPITILNWIKSADMEFNLAVIMIEDVKSLFGMSAKSNFGFGYNVGVVNNSGIYLNYSYMLRTYRGRIAFGLKGGTSFSRANWADVETTTASDATTAAASTETAALPRTTSVAGAEVFFISPADGDAVTSPVSISSMPRYRMSLNVYLLALINARP